MYKLFNYLNPKTLNQLGVTTTVYNIYMLLTSSSDSSAQEGTSGGDDSAAGNSGGDGAADELGGDDSAADDSGEDDSAPDNLGEDGCISKISSNNNRVHLHYENKSSHRFELQALLFTLSIQR